MDQGVGWLLPQTEVGLLWLFLLFCAHRLRWDIQVAWGEKRERVCH